MEEYKKLQTEAAATKSACRSAIKNAEDAIEEFIKSQSFTGEELLKMRDDIKIKTGLHGISDSHEPRMDYVLERILTYRKDQNSSIREGSS